MKDMIIKTREYRERLLKDPYRPTYHFAVPDDKGEPGDPNGAFFADGVYHLMYLYRNSKTRAFHWGHISSIDLVHWTHHPDALIHDEGDKGCFSGGAFVDEDGTAYLTFWKFPSKDHEKDDGGIAIAYSKPPYDHWERMQSIAIESNKDPWGAVDLEVNGKMEHISCADPSNIWKMNDWYYMQTGNKVVLDEWGREEDSDPHYQGDWTDLFKSKDLKTWEFVHRFYVNEHLGSDWPDVTEDDMCPSFLPLYDAKENGNDTGKWLQLFISHNKGCQYYIGSLEGETFVPESHGRMSWKDNAFFAPEALVDDKNRHIMWVWMLGHHENAFDRFGWKGVYSFPRVLWLEDEELRMAPAEESEKLQYHYQIPSIDKKGKMDVKNGRSFRMKAEFDLAKESKPGFRVLAADDQSEYIEVHYNKENSALVVDVTHAGCKNRSIKEEAPLVLKDGEKLQLDVFVDKSLVEVYANEKQAICRRVYQANPETSTGVFLCGEKDGLLSCEAWEIAPANPY